ncbi:MAG: hypothetical protein KIH69_020335 [Anaerolineae bacterium]|nr:hypothetical protein [Anaerolineae bacterium]
MNNGKSNFNVADARNTAFHSAMFAGSHMPLNTELEWTPSSFFNVLPAFIALMLAIGAMSKLFA